MGNSSQVEHAGPHTRRALRGVGGEWGRSVWKCQDYWALPGPLAGFYPTGVDWWLPAPCPPAGLTLS